MFLASLLMNSMAMLGNSWQLYKILPLLVKNYLEASATGRGHGRKNHNNFNLFRTVWVNCD